MYTKCALYNYTRTSLPHIKPYPENTRGGGGQAKINIKFTGAGGGATIPPGSLKVGSYKIN